MPIASRKILQRDEHRSHYILPSLMNKKEINNVPDGSWRKKSVRCCIRVESFSGGDEAAVYSRIANAMCRCLQKATAMRPDAIFYLP